MSLLSRSTLGRSVHLKVDPRPRSIADSRKVLRALQSFGELEMFKNLKYESASPAPNTFLAIFKEKESAQAAMKAGSIDFFFPDRVIQHTMPRLQYNVTEGLADRKIEEPRRQANITISASDLDHEAYIARQPYYGRFPRSVNPLHEDIHRRLPRGLLGMAYLDYSKGEVPLRMRRRRDDDEPRSLRALAESRDATAS